MALAQGTARQSPHRLLAGLRRRAVDAASGHHVPAFGVRAGAVPAQPRDQRQGRGAEPPQLADQRADPASGAGAGQHAGRRRTASPICRPRSPRPKASARACSSFSTRAPAPDAEANARHRRRRRRTGHRARRSASARCRRSSCSTSRSPRCASRSPRSRTRSTCRKRATANPTPRSPISAAA